MLTINTQGGDPKHGQGMNPVMKRHLELEIETLQNAPRDVDKLKSLLKVKRRQKDEAMHIEDTERLVTEVEMLKVVIWPLVCQMANDKVVDICNAVNSVL
jgi:hypothetical protein